MTRSMRSTWEPSRLRQPIKVRFTSEYDERSIEELLEIEGEAMAQSHASVSANVSMKH